MDPLGHLRVRVVRRNMTRLCVAGVDNQSRKSVRSFARRKRITKPTWLKLWQNEQTSLLSRNETPDYCWFAYPLDLSAQKSMKREIFRRRMQPYRDCRRNSRVVRAPRGRDASSRQSIKSHRAIQQSHRTKIIPTRTSKRWGCCASLCILQL